MKEVRVTFRSETSVSVLLDDAGVERFVYEYTNEEREGFADFTGHERRYNYKKGKFDGLLYHRVLFDWGDVTAVAITEVKE